MPPELLSDRFLHFTRDGVVRFRLTNRAIMEANSRFAELIGFEGDFSSLGGRCLDDFFTPGHNDLNFTDQLQHLHCVRDFEYCYETRDGALHWVLCDALLIDDVDDDDGPQVLALLKDITERKSDERKLRESEWRYRTLVELCPDAIAVHRNGEYVYLNPAGLTLFGASELAQIRGRRVLDLVAPEDREVVAERIRRVRAAAEIVTPVREIRIQRLDGKLTDVEASGTPIIWHGEDAIQVILRDVTERKAAEQALHASLDEKEVLLREIHHRVKNNLQIISSLLSMQSRSVPDETSKRILGDCRERVRTMALIHEQLYQSENLGFIEFGEYTNNLAYHLFYSYGVDVDKVQLALNIEPVTLDIGRAIPCSLIINELMANALKHAFPDGRRGHLDLELRLVDGNIELRVNDDGIGLPAAIQLDACKTLGLHLINMLVQQLGGVLVLERNGGTRFVVSFSQT